MYHFLHVVYGPILRVCLCLCGVFWFTGRQRVDAGLNMSDLDNFRLVSAVNPKLNFTRDRHRKALFAEIEKNQSSILFRLFRKSVSSNHYIFDLSTF